MATNIITHKILLEIDSRPDFWKVCMLNAPCYEELTQLAKNKFTNDLLNKEIEHFTFMTGNRKCYIECNADVVDSLAGVQELALKIVTKRIDNAAATQQGILFICHNNNNNNNKNNNNNNNIHSANNIMYIVHIIHTHNITYMMIYIIYIYSSAPAQAPAADALPLATVLVTGDNGNNEVNEEQEEGGSDGNDMMGFMDYDDGGDNDTDEALVAAGADDDEVVPAVAGPANVSPQLICFHNIRSHNYDLFRVHVQVAVVFRTTVSALGT